MSISEKILHSSIAEISKEAFDHNWQVLQSTLNPNTLIIPMVKTNAYGHDIELIVQCLQNKDYGYLGVANITESLDLRKIRYQGPILSFGRISNDILEIAHQENITVVLHSKEDLAMYSKAKDKPLCHVEVETGMNRLGFTLNDLLASKSQFEHIAPLIQGVFSHFTDSEDLDSRICENQFSTFKAAQSFFTELSLSPLFHIGNSGSILQYPQYQLDAVRPGIALYGYSPIKNQTMDLCPVLTWKTPIVQIKHVNKGDSVGYNQTFTAKAPMTLATLSVGYGDGFMRSYQDIGVGFQKQRIPIIGKICMDLCMIDISNTPDAQIGDWVYLMGSGNHGEATASEFAKVDQTIDYEILTRITNRVVRVLE